MTLKPHNLSRGRQRGFSLVEVLVVIAVIAIVSAIAIPTMTRILENSKATTARRNAQLVAGVASQAMHAGNTSLMTAATKEDAVAMVAAGVTGENTFESIQFKLPMSAEDQQAALPYLVYDSGLLIFNDLIP